MPSPEPKPFSDADRSTCQILKALTHPCRLRILRLLSEHPRMPFAHIAKRMPLHPSTVDQHMCYLLDRDLLVAVSDGTSHWYSLKTGRLKTLILKILALFSGWEITPANAGKFGLRSWLFHMTRRLNNAPFGGNESPKKPP